MRLRRLAFIGLLGPTLLAQTGILGPAPCAQTPGLPAELEIRVVSVVSQYGWLRKQAEAGTQSAAPSLKAAGQLLDQMAKELQSEEAWNLVAAPLLRCGNSMDYVVAAEQLPEQATLGKLPVNVRENAIRLASALNQSEPHFLTNVWPAQNSKLLATREKLVQEHGKQLGECLTALRKDLALRPSLGSVPIFLVHDYPDTGSTGVLAAPKFGFGIVGIQTGTIAGSRLVEALLHQYATVLDLVAPDQQSATRSLAAELSANGVPGEGTIGREAVRLMRAVAAADVVTRLLTKKHVANGESLGWFAASDAIANPIRQFWPEAVAGKRPREEVVAEIAAQIAEKAVARPSPRPHR